MSVFMNLNFDSLSEYESLRRSVFSEDTGFFIFLSIRVRTIIQKKEMDTEFAIAATEPISLLSFMELYNHSF